jgi:HSP20 family molecular chaperone IbpA
VSCYPQSAENFRQTSSYFDVAESKTYRLVSDVQLPKLDLPKKINPDKVKAEFKNGLLRLTAEVAAEARAKKIKTEAA